MVGKWRWGALLALALTACAPDFPAAQPLTQAPSHTPFAVETLLPTDIVQEVAQAQPTLIPTQTPPPAIPTLTELQQEAAAMPVIRTAPELHDGIWLNTGVPYKLSNLRGKVVLIDMWTFG